MLLREEVAVKDSKNFLFPATWSSLARRREIIDDIFCVKCESGLFESENRVEVFRLA